MYEDKVYQIALSLIPGIGEILVKNLLSHFTSPHEIFNATRARLLKVPRIGAVNVDNILSFSNFDRAHEILEKSKALGLNVLFLNDKEYPARLRNEMDSPVVIYQKGDFDLNFNTCIAIVGTRNSTRYGRDFLDRLFQEIAPFQPVIISGLAYGIDIHAHKLAIKHNLPTVAILANSLDTVYPEEHRSIAKDIIKNGCLISENPVYTKAEAYMFPSRNRIIASLSDGVFVVEAGEKGGALITANLANNYGREVMALPGDITRIYSKGCNALIKSGQANLVQSPEDLVNIMRWELGKNNVRIHTYSNFEHLELSKDEMSIINTIRTYEEEIHIDDLSWKSQIPINKLATSLLNLELNGIIKALPGKRYKIVG